MTKARLQKLNAIYKRVNNKATLPKALAELKHRHTAMNITHNKIAETKLHKHYKLRPLQELNGTWPIPDFIYDASNRCFNIQRVIHCNPINLPLRAKTYISHDPKDADFGAIPYAKRHGLERPSPCRTTRPKNHNKLLNKHCAVSMHIDTPP